MIVMMMMMMLMLLLLLLLLMIERNDHSPTDMKVEEVKLNFLANATTVDMHCALNMCLWKGVVVVVVVMERLQYTADVNSSFVFLNERRRDAHSSRNNNNKWMTTKDKRQVGEEGPRKTRQDKTRKTRTERKEERYKLPTQRMKRKRMQTLPRC